MKAKILVDSILEADSLQQGEFNKVVDDYISWYQEMCEEEDEAPNPRIVQAFRAELLRFGKLHRLRTIAGGGAGDMASLAFDVDEVTIGAYEHPARGEILIDRRGRVTNTVKIDTSKAWSNTMRTYVKIMNGGTGVL